MEIAKGLSIPLALTFAPGGRIFFAEVKTGAIRLIQNDRLIEAPVAQLEVSVVGELGLTGLAVDPDFQNNRRLYAHYTPRNADGSPQGGRVVRLVENNGTAQEDKVILDQIPEATDKHVAGRMTFGPDGNLYIAIGDTQRPRQAQETNSLAGKILRLTRDGAIPADNPFPGSAAYAIGFRNPYGLGFDPLTGFLFAVDNGPNLMDEVNLVERGGNYGHPITVGPSDIHKSPVWHSGDEKSSGVTGLAVTRNSPIPALNNRILFCTFEDNILHSLPISQEGVAGPDEPISGVACQLDVAVSPEGTVYVTGVGSIYRIDPMFDQLAG